MPYKNNIYEDLGFGYERGMRFRSIEEISELIREANEGAVGQYLSKHQQYLKRREG